MSAREFSLYLFLRTSERERPLSGGSGTKKMKGRVHFENFFAGGFRTSGLSLSFSAPSKVTDEL